MEMELHREQERRKEQEDDARSEKKRRQRERVREDERETAPSAKYASPEESEMRDYLARIPPPAFNGASTVVLPTAVFESTGRTDIDIMLYLRPRLE